MKREVAWAAGFLDGEGSFLCIKNGNHWRYTLSAPQKDRRPLERLQRALGGAIYRANHRELWVWQVSARAECERIMDLLWPFLSEPKQEQITEARQKVQAYLPTTKEYRSRAWRTRKQKYGPSGRCEPRGLIEPFLKGRK